MGDMGMLEVMLTMGVVERMATRRGADGSQEEDDSAMLLAMAGDGRACRGGVQVEAGGGGRE